MIIDLLFDVREIVALVQLTGVHKYVSQLHHPAVITLGVMYGVNQVLNLAAKVPISLPTPVVAEARNVV